LPQIFRIDLNSHLLSLTTIGNVKLLLASDALTTAVLSNGPLSSDSAVIFSRVKISIVIHRNIRFFLRLMVKVEVPASYELSTSSGGGPASETQ